MNRQEVIAGGHDLAAFERATIGEEPQRILTGAEAQLRRKLGDMDRATRQMFDDRGVLTATPAQWHDHEAKLERQAEAALEAYVSAVNRAADPHVSGYAEAERDLARAKATDPILSLSPSEAVRATTLRDHVAGEVNSLSMRDLAARLRAVADSGDRVGATLYFASASRRVAEERSHAIDSGHPLSSTDFASLEAAVTDLERAALGEAEVKRRAGLQSRLRASEKALTFLGGRISEWDDRPTRARFGLAHGSLWQRLFRKADLGEVVHQPPPDKVW